MYVRTSIALLGSALAGSLLVTDPAAACAEGPARAQPLTASDLPELGESLSVTRSVYRNAAQRLSINAPIAMLCADPRAKAVLDTDLPGLTSRPEYIFFKSMSLRRLQSMSHGRLTDADLAKVDAELAKLEITASYEASEQ